MTTARIGINGFGRIGRQLFKILWEQHPKLQIAAIGVAAPEKTEVRAHLLQWDSTYGKFPHTIQAHISVSTNALTVDGRRIPIIPRLQPDRTQEWGDYGVDLVIDCTGRCKREPGAQEHLREGAKKVIITCPTRWADVAIVFGVNEGTYVPPDHQVISSSSCTTNSLAPVVKVLDDTFGLVEGFVTTVHAYTNSQRLLDTTHKDPRRARAAGQNIIPTTTGAAKALDQILPGLGSRIDAAALRVPVPTVSMIDLTARLRAPVTAERVNGAFRRAAADALAGILDVSDEPLVSTDYVGNPHSAVIDAPSTRTIGDLIRVVAWYDNEWGFSCRVADLMAYVVERGLPQWSMRERVPATARPAYR